MRPVTLSAHLGLLLFLVASCKAMVAKSEGWPQWGVQAEENDFIFEDVDPASDGENLLDKARILKRQTDNVRYYITCKGVPRGSAHWVPGLDTWCANNCPRGYCPQTHCDCYYVPAE